MTTGTIRQANSTAGIVRSPVLTTNAHYGSGDPRVLGRGTLVLVSREVPPRLEPVPASPASGRKLRR